MPTYVILVSLGMLLCVCVYPTLLPNLFAVRLLDDISSTFIFPLFTSNSLILSPPRGGGVVETI